MLHPIIQMLRESGVPFHNPYRKNQGAWNPLRQRSGVTSSAVDAVRAFYRSDPDVWGHEATDDWTVEELRSWTKFISADAGFIRGAKKRLREDDTVTISDIFKPEVAMLFGFGTEEERTKWFVKNLTAEGRRRLDYPLSIALKNKKMLGQNPRVVIGTIHSVKGGEADSVYVFPDLSPQQWREYNDTGIDTLRRLYYVAGTRAKETLTLCSPSYGVPAFPL